MKLGQLSESGDRGIRFAQPDGWDFWSYARLAELARQTSHALRIAGVRPGDVVSIVERTGPGFVGALFGTWQAGATASPLAPPMTFDDASRYAAHLTGALAAAQPALVVCAPTALETVSKVTAELGVRTIDSGALLAAGGGQTGPAIDPARLALIQFTSGTSGHVRGVRIAAAALAANVHAIQTWLEMTPDDATASWLPVHHDMGLIGCLLAPLATGGDLWLMPPEEFVRRPLRYLECFGVHGARLTALPGFGLDHITRRVRPEALSGFDFSAWRAVIVGAERVSASTLERFFQLGEPAGLSRSALLPAYGLAEATLAVTGLPLRTGWQARDGDAGTVVGCGQPLKGVTVTVVDDDGNAVPDGQPGEIVVGGTSVGEGYAQSTTFDDGTVRTGDAGVLEDGHLFVFGRLGDSLKIRGRAVFAEDLDALLVAALGIPAGRATTVLGHDNGTATALVILEGARPAWREGLSSVLFPHVGGARLVPVAVPMGTVPRTTSGKPKRRELWAAHLAGTLTDRA